MRKRELLKVIDDNVGHAHFTRGMNMQTLDALRKATTAADLPILEAILAEDDRVAAMTAANVLAEMGDDGVRALERAVSARRHAAPERAELIEDVLREAKRTPSALDDPFEQPPRGTSPNCGPDERRKKLVRLASKSDFVKFVREGGASISPYLRLDNFRTSRGDVDWERVAAGTTVSTLPSGAVAYTLEVVPLGCSTFTLRMTADGYTSFYGCCGK